MANLSLGRKNDTAKETTLHKASAINPGSALFVLNDNGQAIQGTGGASLPGVSGFSDSGDGVRATSTNGNGLSARSTNSVAIFAESTNNTGVAARGKPAGRFEGDVIVTGGGDLILEGADVAEQFDLAAGVAGASAVEPGLV